MISKISILMRLLCLTGFAFVSGCGGDDGPGPVGPEPFNRVHLDLYDTPALGGGFVFEIWVGVTPSGLQASPSVDWASLAQFSVKSGPPGRPDTLVAASGLPIPSNTFTGFDGDFDDYDTILVTLEPGGASDGEPSQTVLLSGRIPPNLESLGIEGLSFPLGLASRRGQYVLTTPTDSNADNDTSGVWFMLPFFPLQPGLIFPPSGPGWRYEGWVRHAGLWLSTGRFSAPTGADESSAYSASDLLPPPFPGEDFLLNPPQGVTFPWVLTALDSVAVTLEPEPDTGPEPSLIRLLHRQVGEPVSVGIAQRMDSTSVILPSATAVFMRPE